MSEIPKTAIEAAAKAMFLSVCPLGGLDWENPSVNKEAWRTHSRASLTAAAPFMYEALLESVNSVSSTITPTFADGIEAAALMLEGPKYQLFALASAIRALKPETKP